MTDALAIDLFCGVGGWTDGLLAEGWSCIGFDIERHQYGAHRYPADLVLQDVRTLHGSQFRDAGLIVASPPCQFFSYTAMPWSRAKALAAEVEADIERLEAELALFKACFRIQREASAAAGQHIPLVVENVRGAQRWVGRARWNFGSYYLWGDVPALMPPISRTAVLKPQPYQRRHGTGSWFAIDMASSRAGITHPAAIATKNPGFRFDGSGRSFQTTSVECMKHKDQDGYERNHPNAFGWKSPRTSSSNILARKAASAMIAKIPLSLARHIGRVFRNTPHA